MFVNGKKTFRVGRGGLNTLLTVSHAAKKLGSSRKQASHDYFNVFLKARREISEIAHVDAAGTSVLILGCGYNYPDIVLWSTVADQAVGVDVRRAFLRNGFRPLIRDFRESGSGFASALARTFIARVTFHSYYNRLREVSGMYLDEIHQDIVAYDGIGLPFADETFDIVCSNAVLEHVAELGTLSREMRRVTRQSGTTYHVWHNYYALSGAHVPDQLALAHPWGHLFGNPRVEGWMRMIGTYLNRKQPQEIVDLLSGDFAEVRVNQLDQNHNRKGCDSGFTYEGEALLTPELQTRLALYPKEILLTRAYSFLGIRK